MERVRMVGDYELVYEKEMNMYRFMRTGTEDFGAWFSPDDAAELKAMDEDKFFKAAEESIQDPGR